MSNTSSNSNNTPANNTLSVITKWDADKARELIMAGKSLPSLMVKAAPKGAVSKLRAERRESLRTNGHLILAQLEAQNFKVEAFDGTVDPATKTLVANKERKNGDQVVTLKLVRKAETEEDRELKALRSKLAAQEKELEALRLAASR